MPSRGHPSSYSQKIAATICERLIAGESLRTICSDAKMPSKTTVFRWLEASDDFRDQYARARECQAENMLEEILEIADETAADWQAKEDGTEVANHEVVARSRLRVDARKWAMSKLAPKKYGDKVQVGGDPDGASIAVDVKSGAVEEVLRRLEAMAKRNEPSE